MTIRSSGRDRRQEVSEYLRRPGRVLLVTCEGILNRTRYVNCDYLERHPTEIPTTLQEGWDDVPPSESVQGRQNRYRSYGS